MLPLLVFIQVTYYAFVLRWAKYLSDPDIPYTDTELTGNAKLSVIIPIRNEEQHLPELLQSFSRQELNKEYWEVIFVDDHSTDGSAELIERSGQKYLTNFQLIRLPGDREGKKAALKAGVKQSKHAIIIQTDADVIFGPKRLSEIKAFADHNYFDLLVLPVSLIPGSGILSSFESNDLHSFQAIAMAQMKMNIPMLCSGANLAYRKEEFLKAQSELRSDISSGDDMFLLSSFIKNGKAICHHLNKDVTVYTHTSDSWSELINQRTRWGGKTSKLGSTKLIGLAILGLAANFSLILFFLFYPYQALIFFILKIIFDYQLVNQYLLRIGQQLQLLSFIRNSMIYPVFMVLVALLSLVHKPIWKGRRITT